MDKTFYITTAIDYVNGAPHLGHAYEKVLVDVLARYHRQKKENVFFLTGTDEHGQKVQQTAAKLGRKPKEFCDEMSERFRQLCQKLDISNDDFIRTTEERHQAVVQQILNTLYQKGEIYKGTYEGFYSTRQEQFLTEKEMVNGKFPEIFGDVTHITESVYYFKMSKYLPRLKAFLQQNPNFVFPSFRTKEVLGALDTAEHDLCISRPKSRLNWGIPLPFDSEQVTYVWFDALINYISAIEYGTIRFNEYWPAIHVIGKDILIPAHAIYWTTILMSLELPLPRQIIAHGWWTQNKEKMSKSLGNVVDPFEVIEKYGSETFRYFVMREMSIGYDADFSFEQLHMRYQSDLGNDLGNLVNRTISMIGRYRTGLIPQYQASEGTELDLDFERVAIEAIQSFHTNMEAIQTHIALKELWRGFTRANQFIEESAPWKLAKDTAQAKRLDQVLGLLSGVIIALTLELKCFLPQTSERILAQFGVLEKTFPNNDIGQLYSIICKCQTNDPTPLFPRIDLIASQ